MNSRKKCGFRCRGAVNIIPMAKTGGRRLITSNSLMPLCSPLFVYHFVGGGDIGKCKCCRAACEYQCTSPFQHPGE
ncbi:hypothetical protein XELAEV_18011375mg [Xenopus laevis]|uniref:Uncharacterized protein n=1 Tax=Xenopus laevis TaxID=8355 RepID=A0A974DLQ9_XENLA|nr:hypothetical protein XELAEV_18011375mg [Xenopus laevis]